MSTAPALIVQNLVNSAMTMYIMEEVGIAELRRNLSTYLRRVAEGERFTVTDHNRPVAMLGPPAASMTSIDRLIAEGKAIPPKRRPGTFEPLQTPGAPTSMTDALLAMRAEERW
ncbi:MAG: type II toxin-antitoxin system Phd/YefM family antitoxin [Gaiellales bacterium]